MSGFRKSMIRLGAPVAGLCAVGALAGINSANAQTQRGAQEYTARLVQLNNSGASGVATLRLATNGRALFVHITARGLEPGNVHVSHIHGRSSGGQPVDSTCPTIAQDTDKDGFVELAEGQVTYGPILIDFMNVDPDKDGVVDFTTTIRDPGNFGALPLDKRHIVIHGKTVGAVGAGTPGEVDGTAGFKTVLPVLCGEIIPRASQGIRVLRPFGDDRIK